MTSRLLSALSGLFADKAARLALSSPYLDFGSGAPKPTGPERCCTAYIIMAQNLGRGVEALNPSFPLSRKYLDSAGGRHDLLYTVEGL